MTDKLLYENIMYPEHELFNQFWLREIEERDEPAHSTPLRLEFKISACDSCHGLEYEVNWIMPVRAKIKAGNWWDEVYERKMPTSSPKTWLYFMTMKPKKFTKRIVRKCTCPPF